jgi:hypothetical protein
LLTPTYILKLEMSSFFGWVKKVVFSIIDCDSIYFKTAIVESCRRRIKTFSVFAGLKKIPDLKEKSCGPCRVCGRCIYYLAALVAHSATTLHILQYYLTIDYFTAAHVSLPKSNNISGNRKSKVRKQSQTLIKSSYNLRFTFLNWS